MLNRAVKELSLPLVLAHVALCSFSLGYALAVYLGGR